MACETKTLIPDALYMTIMGPLEMMCGKCAMEHLKKTVVVVLKNTTKCNKCDKCQQMLMYDRMQFDYMKEKHETGSVS